jgi:hypothetical protein
LTANSALLIEFEIIELEMAPEVEIVEDETPGEVPSEDHVGKRTLNLNACNPTW